MTQILVCGPESTGGRFLTRWLAQDDTLTVHHWSMPHGAGEDRHWPDDHDFGGHDYDLALVAVRCWAAMTASQVDHHPYESVEVAETFAREAIRRCVDWCHGAGVPWQVAGYEAVVAGHVVGPLLTRLVRPPLEPPEEIIDGCAKWLPSVL